MATEAKTEGFTPGPWMVYISRPSDLGHTVYHVATHIETAVAVGREFWAPEDVPEQDEHGYYQPDKRCDLADHRLANAHLIAAAPDLYAALKELLDGIDRWDAAVSKIVDCSSMPKWAGKDRARAALRKAGGAA